MSRASFRAGVERYLPSSSIDLVYNWLAPHDIKLKIAKPRISKLGDFRTAVKGRPAQISVNGNLNPYSFLITLAHEVAHLKDYAERGHLREAHGKPWKKHYQGLLQELIEAGAFPPDLIPALSQHIDRPKAASCSDPTLLDALRSYDKTPGLRLKDIHDEVTFSLSNGRTFTRGPLRRTRYKCQEVASGKWYLIHGEAEVSLG